jgi:hypothetical protein
LEKMPKNRILSRRGTEGSAASCSTLLLNESQLMSLAIVFLFINSAIKPILRKVENAKGNGKLNNYYQIPFVIPDLLFVKDRRMYPNNLLDLNKTNLYGIKKMLDTGLRCDDDLRIVHGTDA